MIMDNTLKVELLDGGQIPTRNMESAGYDLYAAESKLIYWNSSEMISLGIKTQIPTGFYGQIFDRSGMASKGFHVMGGVIDNDYRGEWKVILLNTTKENYRVKMGDRIAQVVFLPYQTFQPVQVESLTQTDRGNSGFGSSGV